MQKSIKNEIIIFAFYRVVRIYIMGHICSTFVLNI
jgi:hypothetical protein